MLVAFATAHIDRGFFVAATAAVSCVLLLAAARALAIRS